MPRRSEVHSKQQKAELDDLYGLFIQNVSYPCYQCFLCDPLLTIWLQLPRHVGWQDLKDQVRQICPNAKVKHADVSENGDGINDGISHIIINGKEPALSAYRESKSFSSAISLTALNRTSCSQWLRREIDHGSFGKSSSHVRDQQLQVHPSGSFTNESPSTGQEPVQSKWSGWHFGCSTSSTSPNPNVRLEMFHVSSRKC